ncbi:MAG: LysR substrate-binding domain-containing protein [Kiloniellales bacterium]
MNEIERLGEGLETDLLRSFLAVAQQGSVTRAAAQLGRTQSAISVQIKRLESLLAIALFERQARGVRLTDAGQRLLPRARQLLEDLYALRLSFSDRLTGRLAIGIPDDYGPNVLPQILHRFCQANPGVELSMRCGFSAGFPKAVAEGELDLAVYAAEEGEILRAHEPLARIATHWVSRVGWKPAPEGEAVPLALFDRDCWWRERAIQSLSLKGRSFKIVLTSESVWGVKAAVSAGLAVAMLAHDTLEADMQILGEADGFPPLPASTLTLIRNPQSASPALDRMVEAIRFGFARA